MEWLALRPHPKHLVFDCPCGRRLGVYLINNLTAELKTCPNCLWQGSFDATTEKKEEIKQQEKLFIDLMQRIRTECSDFCLYL